MSKEKEEEVRVARLDELDALAMELNKEHKVFVHVQKYYFTSGSTEVDFIVSLEGNNELGREVKEKVEKVLGVKLKAAKEVLAKGMIEFKYEIPGEFMVRLDKAMTCEKVGTEEKEVEYKVEISPGKEAVMETKKKTVVVPIYRCVNGVDVEFRGDAE